MTAKECVIWVAETVKVLKSKHPDKTHEQIVGQTFKGLRNLGYECGRYAGLLEAIGILHKRADAYRKVQKSPNGTVVCFAAEADACADELRKIVDGQRGFYPTSVRRKDDEGVFHVVVLFQGVEGFMASWTEPCAGCTEVPECTHEPEQGCGCDGCGYTGKHRRVEWIPFDGNEWFKVENRMKEDGDAKPDA